MSISLLLEMAASSNPERTALVDGELRLTTQQLSDLADGGAGVIAGSGAQHVVYVGTGGAMLPLLIFASARAGLPFTPINYRLSAEGIAALIQRLPEPLVIADDRYRGMVGDAMVLVSDDFRAAGFEKFDTEATTPPQVPELLAQVVPELISPPTWRNSVVLTSSYAEYNKSMKKRASTTCVPRNSLVGNWNIDR